MTDMARVELIDNGVIFKEEPHEYWLGEKQLFGITDVIRRQVESARNEYDNCPEVLIRKAGEYGTSVHQSIQRLINEFDHDGTVEVEDFISLTKDMNIERSEYNVSDLNHWASNIDIVSRVSDNEFDLCDIKTYSGKLNSVQTEKARWQLSIYAYLFELQNQGAKVRNLYILHIRNKQRKDGSWERISEKTAIDRIPSDICKELLQADLEGRQFVNPLSIPEEFTGKLVRLKELVLTKNQAEEEISQLKQDVMSTMEILDVTSWVTDEIRLTRKLPSTRSSFDLKLFKSEHPDIDYDRYMKTSNIAGSLMIAV